MPTPQQERAAKTLNKNLQIIACAGSGKTQTISERVIEILREKGPKGLKPANVVAFTFTDKAAAELKDRISTLASEAFGNVTGIAEMYVGTIHGFCLDILQSYLLEFLKFSVLNEVQTKLLISRNSVKSGLKEVEIITGPSKGQKLTRGRQDVRAFLDALNILREDIVDGKKVPKAIKAALDSYTDLLDRHRYLDYSRIMVEAVAALHREDNAAAILMQKTLSERIKFLIVDEYQDVNPIQESLVRRLHELGANVCVVGDDDQTIYQFRGSEIRNILEFGKRYKGVVEITLADNFRSSPGVVTTAKDLIEKNNPHRLPKPMVAKSIQTFERGDILGLTFSTPEEEARWIASKILSMRGVRFQDDPKFAPRGLSWSDCAILLRSVGASGSPIVAALKAAGIPYIVSGLTNLFESDEVKACVSLFTYMLGKASKQDVIDAWTNADMGLARKDIDRGLAVIDKAKKWDEGERWAAYNIQRVYLGFLEAIGIREERIPPTSTGAERGEIVYYNLGKFSQAISDFEQIHFQSAPEEKYTAFFYWLQNEAPDSYEEGGEHAGYAQPDAVQILTVHKAKGMEWPVVFVPALQKNRFPSTVGGRGRNKWHILPRDAVKDAARYDGSVEDERRLFHVAITRSKKFLLCTYAPIADNQLFRKPSEFFQDFTSQPNVLTAEPQGRKLARLTPKPKRDVPNVVISFSELKYIFECPYSFKLRFMYGFNPPLYEGLGFGKTLHDALSEVHKEALTGTILTESAAAKLIDRHLHVPFAYPKLREQLRAAAVESIQRYLRVHGPTLKQTLYSELQVEVQIVPGITVNGRIDLIKKLDTDEVAIIDFKSSERAQAEDVTRSQLHTYAIGYRQLTGKDADLVEVLNLDQAGKNVREVIDSGLLKSTETAIRQAGNSIRDNKLERLKSWCKTCETCDLVGVCRGVRREGVR